MIRVPAPTDFVLKNVILIIAMLAFGYCLKAQFTSPQYEIGISVGILVYQGDLTPTETGSYKTMKPVFGIYGNRILNNSFTVRFSLAFGKLKGDDAKYQNPAWRQQRNFNFTTPLTEISALLIYDVFGKNKSETNTRFLRPYIFGGVGYSFLKIKRDWNNFNYAHFNVESEVVAGLAADINHSLPKAIPVFPFGIGIRYSLSQSISFTAESAYRSITTDYLDGFSRAANPAKKDHYYSHTIGLLYKFGVKNKLDCPVIRN